MDNIKLSDIYKWKNKSQFSKPWERLHLNVDFLNYEKKHLEKVFSWYYKVFLKKCYGHQLDEVTLYTVPAKLNSGLKAGIEWKECKYLGGSALKNTGNFFILLLFNKVLPKEWTPIRIIKSKKDFVENSASGRITPAVYVEEFALEDDDFIYIDVPYEKHSIKKFLYEEVVKEDIIADALQPTISGSPYVINDKGGIGLFSFQAKSQFSEEFLKTIKMMQPLHYTDLQFHLPRLLHKGKSMNIYGVKYKVGEKSVAGSHYYDAYLSTDLDATNRINNKRKKHRGEYSFALGIDTKGHDPVEIVKDIFDNYVKAEITQPYNTDNILDWASIDLEKAQKHISEDIVLEVVNQKQFFPVQSFDDKLKEKFVSSFRADWKSIMESYGLRKHTEHEVKKYAEKSFQNIYRVAQSLARDEHKQEVNERLLNKAYNIFINNADALIDNDEMQKHKEAILHPEKTMLASEVIYERRILPAKNAIRAELQSNNSLSAKELFENVKQYFKTFDSLIDFLEKLKRNGDVYEPRQGVYKWI